MLHAYHIIWCYIYCSVLSTVFHNRSRSRNILPTDTVVHLYFFWNYIYIDKLFVQGAIKSLARDINQQEGGLEDSSILPRFKEAVTPTDGKHACALSCGTWEQQRVRLLLEFLENLEKAIHNAAEGCATAMLPPPKVSSSSLLHSTLSAHKYFSILCVVSLDCIFCIFSHLSASFWVESNILRLRVCVSLVYL